MPHLYSNSTSYISHNKNLEGIFALSYLTLMIIMFIYMYISNLESLKDPITSLPVIVGASLLYLLINHLFTKHEKSFFKWRSGERGENAILEELKKLSDEYYVFHDIAIKGIGNIDFVIIGPTGIFTIEVKNHRGVIDFNGAQLTLNGEMFKEKDFLNQAMSEALHLRELLPEKPFVNPILVFSNHEAKLHFGFSEIKSVLVIGKPFLLKAIAEKPVIYNKEKIENLSKICQQYYTTTSIKI